MGEVTPARWGRPGFRNQSTWWLIMIHHRPQGFDRTSFRRVDWISSGVVSGSMVLYIKLPPGKGVTGITERACIRIDGDGDVFPTAPHSETGPVVNDTNRGLIARQLDVAANRVHLEHRLPKEGVANEVFGQGIQDPEAVCSALRLLGDASAMARMMLIAAAAERWSASVRLCHAQDGEVIHTPTWRKLKYGELAIDAA